MNFFRNNRGATAVEFALVALPVMAFIIGIIQFGWIVWVDNLCIYRSILRHAAEQLDRRRHPVTGAT